MVVRGIRGAITVERNESEEIIEATQKILESLIENNKLAAEDVCSTFFTVTPDLNAVFPARAARVMGWDQVPLLCAQEIDVPGAIQKCIRVLVHVNTNKSQHEIKHIYLRDAAKLRPDLAD